MSRFPIINRLAVALQRAADLRLEVRAIYLTTEDHDALDRAESARFKRRLSVLDYGGHAIRRGKRSRIYCATGFEIAIPKHQPRPPAKQESVNAT